MQCSFSTKHGMEHWSAQGLRYLKGVGPRIAEKLQRLGLNTQRDLLFHLPLRYEDRTFVTPLGSLQPGQRSQIQAEVLHVGVRFRRQGRSRRVLVAKLADATGMITVRFFYFGANQQKLFDKGNWLRCFGEVRVVQGELEMVHPETELIDIDDPPALPTTLTPIYPTTEGLHQISIKRIVRQAIDKLREDGIGETLPGDWLEQHEFPDITSAMLVLHSPESREASELIAQQRHPAQHRFVVEELAAQHFQNLDQWLTPLGVRVVNLVGADKGRKRTQKEALIASGEAQVVVGTHALFQASVEFHRLGFIIFDEQHRFGVDQRLALQKKTRDDEMAHQLIMTATPIPRTLAMSIYADLDYSQIDELPPGRKPVTTSIVSEQQRASLIKRVATACADGGQVYWVCTLVEESDLLQAEAAELTYESLRTVLPELSVELVHGRMKAAEKDRAISRFKAGEVHILVATTVIEVGVDVPNASIMIIENPERLGLAQIHQLRGRVGRGARESFCILLVKNGLSELARKRLDIIRRSQDGFEIAEKDLEIRGAGEVLGTRQTGEQSFKIADLMRDREWFAEAEQLADLMQRPEYAEMRDELLHNWVGQRQDYTAVG